MQWNSQKEKDHPTAHCGYLSSARGLLRSRGDCEDGLDGYGGEAKVELVDGGDSPRMSFSFFCCAL